MVKPRHKQQKQIKYSRQQLPDPIVSLLLQHSLMYCKSEVGTGKWMRKDVVKIHMFILLLPRPCCQDAMIFLLVCLVLGCLEVVITKNSFPSLKYLFCNKVFFIQIPMIFRIRICHNI